MWAPWCAEAMDVAAGVMMAERPAPRHRWKGRPLFPIDVGAYEGRAMDVLAANRKVHPKLVAWIGA